MSPATLTCASCGALVALARHGRRCPMCHHLVTGSGQNRDLLARVLPCTRATAALRAAIREHQRRQRASAAGASRDPGPLGFSVTRMLAGERSAEAGRVRPLADVVGELRRRETAK